MRFLSSLITVTALLVPSLAAADDEVKEPPKEAPSEGGAAKSIEKNNHDMLDKGSLILGAERVFGFSSSVEKVGDATNRHTQIGLLWSNPRSVYQFARMGIDYILVDNVTVGGAFGIAHTTSKVADKEVGATNLLVAPRVGYLFGGRGVLSFWARVGPSFWNISGEGQSAWGLAVNLEPAIIISPYQHVGIYLGGVVDLGVAGKIKVADNSQNYTVTNYGVNSGLVTWF